MCFTSRKSGSHGASQQVKPKKIKWGPELQIDRPRRNKNDTRTVMQKATELKCIQNLEAPTKGAGNSFAVLDSQYLAQIADKIDISLGIDTHECLYNVDSMKNDENKKRIHLSIIILKLLYLVIWRSLIMLGAPLGCQ